MKKLTLDQTWKLCMSMWRWIAKQKREGSRLTVEQLKNQWLIAHGYGGKGIRDNCFFCEYMASHSTMPCEKGCPGTRIDKKFWCLDLSYHFLDNPIAFYNKLVSLNRKRLAKKDL